MCPEPLERGPAGRAAAPGERPDFLVRLGVLWPCTVEDVKQAYLAKAKRLHPDKGGDPAEFLALQQAFEQAQEYAAYHAGRTAWLGTNIERYLAREALVAELVARGGRVQLEGVDWLRREIGDDFAQLLDTIAGLELTGPTVDDATLGWLAAHAGELAALHVLDLSDSRVSDAGLGSLAALSSLRRLDLHRTSITARGLEVIGHLPKLTAVGLCGVRLGWFARRRLERAHPEVTLLVG